MGNFIPAFIQQNIRFKFLALSVPLTLAVAGVITFVFWSQVSGLVKDLGARVAHNQVLLDRARAAQPLLRELALAEILASDPTLLSWAEDESDAKKKSTALATLERFRQTFRDQNYFLVIDESLHFFFDDGSKTELDLISYTISDQNEDDKWYFKTRELPDQCYLNVDFDRAIQETKVWVNCNVRHPDGRVVAVVGTGIELTAFVNAIMENDVKDVTSMYLDADGAIQVHPDLEKIDQDSLTKPTELKNTIFGQFENETDAANVRSMFARLKTSPGTADTLNVRMGGNGFLLGATYIPQMNWFSVTVMDIDRIVLSREFFSLTVFVILSMVLTVVIVNAALNRIVLRRIDRMDRQVSSFRKDRTPGMPTDQDRTPDELGRLEQNFDDMSEEVRTHTVNLEKLVAERTEKLEQLASQDHLTGVCNRRSFLAAAESIRQRAKRFGDISSVMMLDLDHFKKVNDLHGHGVGDEVLKEFATLCDEALRDVDVFGRLGGEEFSAILVNTDIEHSKVVAERIRNAFKSIQFEGSDGPFRCTVSIGIAAWIPPDRDLADVLDDADTALYAAKDAGRDQTLLFEDTVA